MAESTSGPNRSVRWYNAVIAVCCGLLVSLAVAELRQYQVVVLPLLCLASAGRAQVIGASDGGMRLRGLLVSAVVLIPSYLLLVWPVQVFGHAVTGQTLAAALAGVVLSAVLLLLPARTYGRIRVSPMQ